MSPSRRGGLLAVFICILGASFYMYEFLLQVSVGVMTTELMRDLGINAASLGIVSAFYYYAYMPLQVPAGLLHDRFGPRAALTTAILICAMGALCFSASHNMWQAAGGRFLMGVGSAFSFSGALLLIARWFPAKQFAIMSGFVQLMSSIGAIAGEAPLAIAINHWGWRQTMEYLAIIGISLACLVWLIVRNFPKVNARHPEKNLVKPQLRAVFVKSQSWWLALYSFLVWAPIAAFAGLWGIPFLVAAHGLSIEWASVACSAIWIGVGIASPLVGFISEHIQRRSIILISCAILGVVGAVGSIYFTFSPWVVYLTLFILGCGGSGQALAFAVVRDITHPGSIGAAIGFNNMATVAGGAILQPVIGYLIHIHHNGIILNGIPFYGVADYRFALFMIPLSYVLALFISLFCIKETYCQEVSAVYDAPHE